MKKIMNLELDGVDLMDYASVFIIHPHMGWALRVMRPCNCGDDNCENQYGGIEWLMENGLGNGLRLQGIAIKGDTHESRLAFIEQLAEDLHKIDAYVLADTTLHLMPNGFSSATTYRDALPKCYPVPDPRWHGLVKFFSEWVEVERALFERKEIANGRFN